MRAEKKIDEVMNALGVSENRLKPAAVKILPSNIVPVKAAPILTTLRSQAILIVKANLALGSTTT